MTRLDPAGLRARLSSSAAPAEMAGLLDGDDGHRLTAPPLGRTPAAVLIGLVGHLAGPAVILTQRTAHLKDHAGQISFPGGRIEAADPDAIAAALREAEEEVGIDPARVEILGELEPYDTVTGFRIHPVVGWIEPPLTLRPDPYEVAEIFEVPLTWTLDPVNHRRDSYTRDGRVRSFYVLPYADRYIWGATAGMLVNLARRLGTPA
jgi:8-oxo-dGTP pyrophosphatase MutT (NUDIX family)